MRFENVGGLAVAFQDASAEAVDRALKQLDPNLFLAQDRCLTGPHGAYDYWRVLEHKGDRLAPFPVIDWRDRSGPRPLTMAIVEHVKRQEKRDEKLLERINEANAAREAAVDRDSDEQYDEITRSFERAARNGGHFSGPVHRSRGLYLARSKARSEGRSR